MDANKLTKKLTYKIDYILNQPKPKIHSVFTKGQNWPVIDKILSHYLTLCIDNDMENSLNKKLGIIYSSTTLWANIYDIHLQQYIPVKMENVLKIPRENGNSYHSKQRKRIRKEIENNAIGSTNRITENIARLFHVGLLRRGKDVRVEVDESILDKVFARKFISLIEFLYDEMRGKQKEKEKLTFCMGLLVDR